MFITKLKRQTFSTYALPTLQASLLILSIGLILLIQLMRCCWLAFINCPWVTTGLLLGIGYSLLWVMHSGVTQNRRTSASKIFCALILNFHTTPQTLTIHLSFTVSMHLWFLEIPNSNNHIIGILCISFCHLTAWFYVSFFSILGFVAYFLFLNIISLCELICLNYIQIWASITNPPPKTVLSFKYQDSSYLM